MSFLHTALKSINGVLAPLGIVMIRSKKIPWRFPGSFLTTQVGRYTIKVPTSSPVIWQYRSNAGLASHLGRLTSLIKNKYLDLAVIDVGANVGDTVCIIKSAEDVPVLCIEGDFSTFGFLQKNILQFSDVSAHALFLGEKTETINVDFENRGWNLTLKPGTSLTAKPIQLFTLDDFLSTQVNTHRFKLLKIDTEGFDCSIIRGAPAFLENVAPTITFEYNRGNMDAIGEPGLPTLLRLEQLGYSHIVFHDQNGRFLVSTTLSDRVLIKDLHNYADCVAGRIGYLDVTAFHMNDTDLAEIYVNAERALQIASKSFP